MRKRAASSGAALFFVAFVRVGYNAPIMKDKDILQLIARETARQKKTINLIASENIVSADVCAALGSVFTNKYAEGYPGRRYYGGNAVVDEMEQLAIARALALFGLSPKKWHVNVQPLSGSPANLAVYAALFAAEALPIRKGKIMGMSLAHGGHLTHGHHVSLSGKLWTQVAYGLAEGTEQLDYKAIRALALRERPDVIVAGYTAYSRAVDWKKFRAIADESGALFMVDMSHVAGLVAGKVHASPFPYADVVTTTTHKTLRGPRGAMIFVHKEVMVSDAKSELPLWEFVDKAVFPGLQGGPHENAIAGIAVALGEAQQPEFGVYATQVVANAKTLAAELTHLGWRIVSGGTDNHLFLVDVAQNGISGARASAALEAEGIIVNKNAIPFDTRPPADPSGIRLGTAWETTRGKKETDMIKLARRIDRILRRAIAG